MSCEMHSNLERLLGLSGIWFKADSRPAAEPLVLISLSSKERLLCLARSRIAGGEGVVGFSHRGKPCQLRGRLRVGECGEAAVEVELHEDLPGALGDEVQEYLRLDSNAERRRGVRYVVGLKENRWMHFGLGSRRQRFIVGKNMIDVVISDVSSHGALITGEMLPSLVVGREIVSLQVSFVNPQETLVLPALVVRVDRPIPKIAQYALKFIEPVSIRWMGRVDEYALLSGQG